MFRIAVVIVMLCLAVQSENNLRGLFELIDYDHDDALSLTEIDDYLMKFQEEHPFVSSTARLRTLFELTIKRLDKNMNRKVDWIEWYTHYYRLSSSASLVEEKRHNITSEVPQQIHLTLTGNPTEMVVMWVTSVKSKNTTVQYAKSPSFNLTHSATGVIDTYTAGVDGWSGLIHTVILQNLSQGTEYNYRVGDPVLGLWSNISRFSTPPNNLSATVAIFGDMGTVMPMGFEVTNQIIRDRKDYNFDLIVHVGDLAYAGVSAYREFEYIWDLWQEQVAPLASEIPYMTSVGNHEKYYNFSAYRHRFKMPSLNSGGLGNFYFSFDYAGAHFVSMSTEAYATVYAPGSPQYDWLVKDLTKANLNRKQTPWIIFLGHRPMYSSDTQTDSGPLQTYIEPLLYKYKVDLAVWGHMHCYERTYPVYNNVPTITSGNIYKNPNATVHLTIGTAGALIDETFVDPAPAWSAKRKGTLLESSGTYGYGVLQFLNKSHLHFKFLTWETNSKVFDELWIIKS